MYKTTTRFRFELNPPMKEDSIANYYNKFEHHLRKYSNSISLTSKTLNSVKGFVRNQKFLSHLSAFNQDLDILLHLTCFDVDRNNLNSTIRSLHDTGINRLLIISGENFKPKEPSIEFRNSQELIDSIDLTRKLKTLAIAGYPSIDIEQNELECSRLIKRLKSTNATAVYTQCIMDAQVFKTFRENLDESDLHIPLVPSIALFDSVENLDKVSRLTRVSGCDKLITDLNKIKTKEGQKKFCKEFLTNLIQELDKLNLEEINVCAFNLFEFADELLQGIHFEQLQK